MPSSTSQMAGGPIISISDMDNFMKIGELAQNTRSHRPIKKTSSMDFDLLRASGDAARQRRGSNASEASTCDTTAYTPRSSSLPSASPLLRPTGTCESEFDGDCFGRDRDSFTGLDINVGSPFEIDSPFEIGMASELRIVDAHGY
ncbi:hypothetical protein BOTCAL_0114g00220 [Botryotinia calthae]|uniref:Uncharacterized protein n=1 Tax=Botryotinia calthae TaxID=38488 RepID=A0A4Y8D7N8_9HELO|nr:hypothetical protein BOTCAL_0114g00220 [Botryotinia calthae]